MRKRFTALLLCLCFALGVWAQKVVTGRVTDPQGNPVPNASVTVKGTNFGTVTKDDGSYSISLPADASVLVFSSVGLEPQEIIVGSRNSVAVVLNPVAGSMEEVLVVAYGTQKRESITGSVAKIGAEQLEKRLTTNITQALAGAAPGISATSGNGQPGSSAAIRIRGFGSVNLSSSPLFVVDGFPYEGYIGDLNTNDIESITLLKDAASTALYGARAANGVVMVTTKKGKTGAPKVNIMVNTGFSQRGISEYDRVGAYDYYPLIWQGIKNSLMYPASGTPLSEAAASLQASNTVATQLIYNPFGVPNDQVVGTDGKMNANARLQYNDFDWYSPMEQNGLRKEGAFTVSSKINKTDYYFSLNYLKDEGFLIKSDYERVTARLSLNTQIKDWLRTGVNISGIFVGSNQASGDGSNTFINPFVFARGMGPIYPVHAFTPTGDPILDAFGNQWYDFGMHPGAINRPGGASPGRHVIYETMLNNRLDKRNSLIGRTFVEASFLKHFKFTTNLGVDLNNVRTYRFQNKIVGDGVTAGGTASRTANEYRTISLNQLLNYSQKFGRHSVGVLAGHEMQRVDEDYFSGSRRGMNLDGNEELINFVTLNAVTGERDFLRREAFLSRVNYSYDNKYYFDVSYRRDASSRFSPQKRWGNFYSVGASWSIMREKFMLRTSNWLSDLKIRAAYGTVGNDGLDTYYGFQSLYTLGWNNALEPGALATSLANPNLTWEVNNTASLGIDFGLFKNRITGSVELFRRGSAKMLFDVPLGPSAIITSLTQNIGTMINQGIEVQLGADIVRSKDVTWNLQVNATMLKNEITKLPDATPTIINGTKRLEKGHDLYAFYLRQWYGVDPLDGVGLWFATPGTTANVRISSKGDTLTADPNAALYAYSGSAIPKVFGSIINTVSYKGFSLSFLLNYQIGGKFYDGNYAGLMGISYGGAMHTDALKAWKQPGDVTSVPRLDIARTSVYNSQSDRWLIDASYLNIRNVSLGYNLPSSILSKLHFDQAKIYISGENLLILSKRKGMNPAESFSGTNSPVYVPNRLFNAGINLTF